jgi:hypothetical protein
MITIQPLCNMHFENVIGLPVFHCKGISYFPYLMKCISGSMRL